MNDQIFPSTVWKARGTKLCNYLYRWSQHLQKKSINRIGLFEKKLTGQVLHTQIEVLNISTYTKVLLSMSSSWFHLIFPDLTLKQVRGHRLHPVLPRLHPGQPRLHLPSLALKLLIVNIKLLKLALPCENLAEKYNERKEKRIWNIFLLWQGKTFLMREKLQI